MFNRIYTQYKCVTNVTNARIRNYIKEVEDVTVYIYLTPKHKSTVLFLWDDQFFFIACISGHLQKEIHDSN